ncbi:MAG: hypothetical protein HOL85_02355 [Rhodospirillaceae bacterium]|jgi:hypothetical protein|nr:hypothetical protein [Rhodospirillaceae bacterium]
MFGLCRIQLPAILAVAVMILSGLPVSAAELPQYAKDIHLGVTTCAGSTCHGATAPWAKSTVLQTEYVTWSRKDEHAKAYKVLLNKESKRIAKNLGIAKAEEADLCLDCHADNVPKNMRGRLFQISDGVGCEACHGGGQRWLGLHVTGIASHADNVKAGLYPTEEPLARAELCLSCHFGDERKLVTHRIMGAGHPRMSFELDTFTWIQPSHFAIDADYAKRKAVANGVQVWAIGQAKSMAARLDVMVDAKRGRDGLFPELITFDCQACHHPLTKPHWTARKTTGLGPGKVRIDDSNAIMLRAISGVVDRDLGARLSKQLHDLHIGTATGPDAFLTAAKALKQTVDGLPARFAKHKFAKADISALAKAILADAEVGEYSDYVGAEQAVMALSAIFSAGERMGLAGLAKATSKPMDEAYAALKSYDDWDYTGFRTAMAKVGDAVK